MLKINAEDYRIIVDSREQDLFNYKIFNKNGIQTVRSKLDVCD